MIVTKKLIAGSALTLPIGRLGSPIHRESIRMKINFFDWIREGVRQSILLGLSDAAADIGSEKDVEALNQQFLASLQQNRITDETPKAGGGRRKALGRSLSQIVEAK